jgi:NADH-quinone oxidoreductase subunit N
VNAPLNDHLDAIVTGLLYLKPELTLAIGIMMVIAGGLVTRRAVVAHGITIFILATAMIFQWMQMQEAPFLILGGILKTGATFSSFVKVLILLSGMLTVAMTLRDRNVIGRLPEYYALILTVILGANLLVMSENLLMIFLSMETVSIASYLLTAFAFDKKSTEGSLKYFLFGSIASAAMLYGFSFLYGIFGTFNYPDFQLPSSDVVPLVYVAGILSLAGFLYKLAAAPLHPWAPDVYEAAPMPVVALFSVVPKLAGIAILLKFTRFTNLPTFNWELVLAGVAILTLTVGNFSALWQKNVKRLMAYSSIAQSGFLLLGIVAGSHEGAKFMLFYGSVYVALTYLTFIYLQQFEKSGFTTIAQFAGAGKVATLPMIFLLVGFIGLTGLPPTGGFSGKLFLFSAIWESYRISEEGILLLLIIFGLLNTVVSLFYYLRIPYFAFIRPGASAVKQNILVFENLLAAILVLVILLLFFSPQLLMGWINKSNFVF